MIEWIPFPSGNIFNPCLFIVGGYDGAIKSVFGWWKHIETDEMNVSKWDAEVAAACLVSLFSKLPFQGYYECCRYTVQFLAERLYLKDCNGCKNGG